MTYNVCKLSTLNTQPKISIRMQAHIKILIAIKAASDVVILILNHANKNRLGAIDWGPNDYDVFESERCVERIFLSPAAPSIGVDNYSA